jgi:hypothetical protein
MARTLTTISAALFVLLASKVAWAQKQGFGDTGEFILGADRLVPVLSYSQGWTGHLGNLPAGETGETTTSSQTAFSFFWGSTYPGATFFTVPRIGLDYVLAPHFTIGGEMALFITAGATQSTQIDQANGGSTTIPGAPASRTLFGIAPRAGYVLRLTNLFALWLRGGFSFYTETDTTNVGNNVSGGLNQFSMDLEPQFVITPLPHLGLTIGPTLDVPLFGRIWLDPNESASSAVLFFGITGAAIAYF